MGPGALALAGRLADLLELSTRPASTCHGRNTVESSHEFDTPSRAFCDIKSGLWQDLLGTCFWDGDN